MAAAAKAQKQIRGDEDSPRRKAQPIDYNLVRNLAKIQCTQEEIASVLEIKPTTLRSRMDNDPMLRRAWEEGGEQGKVALRRLQFGWAQKNPTMAIFLGKQYLGQRDVVQNQLTGKDGGPLEVKVLMDRIESAFSKLRGGGKIIDAEVEEVKVAEAPPKEDAKRINPPLGDGYLKAAPAPILEKAPVMASEPDADRPEPA